MKREAVLLPGTYAAIPKALLALPSSKVSPAAKLVWMVIVDHFGPTNDHSWPGAGAIGKATGLTRRGVQKAIDQLVGLGLLTVLPPTQERASNTYQLTEFASALSSLANGVRTPSAQSSLPQRTECAGGSEQSAPELPNTTTELTTETTTEVDAAPPLAALSGGSPSKAAGGGKRKSSPARQSTKAPPKLTEDHIQLLNSDRTAGAMAAYLCFGAEAIGKSAPECAGMEPQAGNWAPTTRDYERPEPDVTEQALAAYYWWRVCQVRGRVGLPITKPKFALLNKLVTEQFEHLGRAELVNRIDLITSRWQEISSRLGRTTPPLDEKLIATERVAQALSLSADRSTPSSGLSPAWQIPTGPVSEDKYAHMYS